MSAERPAESVTSRRNTQSSRAPAGRVTASVGPLVAPSVAGGPETWLHWYAVMLAPPTAALPRPSSVRLLPGATVPTGAMTTAGL